MFNKITHKRILTYYCYSDTHTQGSVTCLARLLGTFLCLYAQLANNLFRKISILIS